jgi:N-ethylmaleimide reductase
MSNSILFRTFNLHNLTIPNRVVLAPMTRSRAGTARLPNQLMAEYYVQRSSAGLLITEATTISEEANGWNESPGIYTDEMTEGWKHVVNAVHEKGGLIFLQLWHLGRSSHSSFHNGKPAVAPSAIKINEEYIHTPIGKQPYEVPRALETSEISRVVDDYRRAAERANAAGFDGVEVHGANGYLIDIFLQSKTNHRTDQYGGSVENRYRFLKEVVEAVTSIWPANRVGVRLSPNGAFNDMGSPDFREQFTFVASQLDHFGLAYLHVMDGLAFGFHKLGEPMTLAELADTALQNNPASRKAWNDARAAVAQVAQAKGYFMPTLVANAGASREKTTAEPDTYDSGSTRYGPGLEVNYLILNFGGGRKAAVEAALQTVYAANFTFNRSIQDILLAAETAYYGVISARAGIQAAEATVKDARTALEATQIRKSAGGQHRPSRGWQRAPERDSRAIGQPHGGVVEVDDFQDVGAKQLTAAQLIGVVGVEQDQRVQIAVAGMEHVGAAQLVFLFHLADGQSALDCENDADCKHWFKNCIYTDELGRTDSCNNQGKCISGKCTVLPTWFI